MHKALLLTFALLCSAGGIAWLALAMEVHWQQARGTAAGPGRRTAIGLRALGGVALAVSFGVCLLADHATMAVLVWVMSLGAAALLVALTLAWRPSWLSGLVAWADRG
ncbi:DUF3325 family protein [Rhizobacter sp. P5_C2]